MSCWDQHDQASHTFKKKTGIDLPELLKITDRSTEKKKPVLIRARAHAYESAGSYAMEGMVRGLLSTDADAAVGKHPGKKYLFTGQPDFTPLREGDTLAIGRYRFRCVETPGHTPGHLCLFEPEAGIFFSGDHILDSITPNISGWAQENEDPLGDFLASLDKVAAYNIRLVLPGHRKPIADHRRRIEELKAHHRVRTQEIGDILSRGAQTAYQVASRMTWDMSYARWADFPVPQQWFATGEALAHLLILLRKIRKTVLQRAIVEHGSAHQQGDASAAGNLLHFTQRIGAEAGDGVWVTGRLGGMALALRDHLAGRRPDPAAAERFARPEPRLAAGQWLAGQGAHAMIDVSDGLSADAGHLAAARAALEMEPRLRIDTLTLVDAQTLLPVKKVRGPALLEGAVYAGETRLTDRVWLG